MTPEVLTKNPNTHKLLPYHYTPQEHMEKQIFCTGPIAQQRWDGHQSSLSAASSRKATGTASRSSFSPRTPLCSHFPGHSPGKSTCGKGKGSKSFPSK